MSQITLKNALDQWLQLTQGRYAKNTQRTNRSVTRQFLHITGDIQMRHLSQQHMETYFYEQPHGLAYTREASTVNLHRSILFAFTQYAMNRGWLRTNPMVNVRPLKVADKQRVRLSRDQLDQALELCRHPRDRMVIALCMYTGMRVSELLSLRMRDISLDKEEIHAKVHKTGKVDQFPISKELDEEFRRWFMFYQDRVGGLLPDYYVLPAKDARGPRGKGKFAELADDVALHPEITMRYPKYLLGYIFQGLGITHKGVGAHTFRRSVARLYYDRMCDEVDSKDHALRLTQTLLNHSTMSTTEGYIGLEKERAERDITIKGQPIFGVRPENVVPLRVVTDDR